MIPGNRPEDEWHDLFHDAIDVPDDLVLRIHPHFLADALNNLMSFLTVSMAEAFKEGLEEQRIAEHEPDPLPARCESYIRHSDGKRIQCERSENHPGDHYNYTNDELWHDA